MLRDRSYRPIFIYRRRVYCCCGNGVPAPSDKDNVIGFLRNAVCFILDRNMTRDIRRFRWVYWKLWNAIVRWRAWCLRAPAAGGATLRSATDTGVGLLRTGDSQIVRRMFSTGMLSISGNLQRLNMVW